MVQFFLNALYYNSACSFLYNRQEKEPLHYSRFQTYREKKETDFVGLEPQITGIRDHHHNHLTINDTSHR